MEPQPELRWAPLPPKPKKTAKVWLIVGIVVAVLVVTGVLLFLLLRDQAPGQSASPNPSASAGATSGSEPDPATTPPPAADPTLEVFRERVSGWLTDAPRGLDIIADASGQDALPVVETLQEDAQRLSDIRPPSAIEEEWREAIAEHAENLARLRTAITDDSDVAAAVDDVRESAEKLRTLVGL